MNKIKHFLQFNDFERDEIDLLFDKTKWIKDQYKSYKKYLPFETELL